MTVPKAMYHYLRWHSTVLRTTDFQYTGDDRLVQYFDADRGSLFDAVDSFMRDGMLGPVVCDRQGKLWAEIESYGLQTPFSTIPQRFTFHKQDWVGSPSIEERRTSELSFIELGGIIYYGVSSNAFSAVLSNAPSTAPLYKGKSDRLIRLRNLPIGMQPGLKPDYPAGLTPDGFSDYTAFNQAGIPIVAFESTNWEIGDLDGYVQTELYGSFWHNENESDTLARIEELFQGRPMIRLNAYTTLVFEFLKHLNP